jgi:hypothetical protein
MTKQRAVKNLQFHLATTTTVQMAAPVPEIMDTASDNIIRCGQRKTSMPGIRNGTSNLTFLTLF